MEIHVTTEDAICELRAQMIHAERAMRRRVETGTMVQGDYHRHMARLDAAVAILGEAKSLGSASAINRTRTFTVES